MEWLVRLLGIGFIVCLFAWSVGVTVSLANELDDRPPSPAIAEVDLAADGSIEPAVADEEVAQPEYLTYTDGFESGRYRVTDDDDDDSDSDSDSDDDDDRSSSRSSRSQRTTESDRSDSSERSSRSSRRRRVEPRDYPVETDLIPGVTLAARGEVEPGLYATTFDTVGCSYELRRVMSSGIERAIGTDSLATGRMLVWINEIEPDSFVANPSCGEWVPWSPLVAPMRSAGNGDYWIGDLATGEWEVPSDCYWEKVVGFRGAELADIVDSGRGPGVLIIDNETYGVRIRGCRPGNQLRLQPAGF